MGKSKYADDKHEAEAQCPFYRKVSHRDGLKSINCGDEKSPQCGIILWWRDMETREEHFAQYCAEDFNLCSTFLAILRENYPEEYKELMKNEY